MLRAVTAALSRGQEAIHRLLILTRSDFSGRVNFASHFRRPRKSGVLNPTVGGCEFTPKSLILLELVMGIEPSTSAYNTTVCVNDASMASGF